MNNAILHFFFYCLIVGKCDNFANLNTEEWNLFKNRYSKTYKLEIDETLRLQTYLNNKNFIDSHNERFRNGEESYKLGMNQFGDMTNSEFASLMNGYKHNSSQVGEGEKIALLDPQNITLPETVDWRDKGAVTGIKDQGTCGSCWTFSTTGSLEGQQYLRSGKLVSLSEQNIIDCSTKYGTFGCEGGLMENAFQYIRDNGGIDTEESYPYEGVSDKCRYKPETSGATVKGSVKIPRGDEEKFKLAVATIGPISVTIDSSLETFEFYQRGVYYDKKCKSKPEDLDHAVLIVGYGTENGMDYWLVKNSWNTSWGLEGYIKMARNKNNHCGIATSAIYPLI